MYVRIQLSISFLLILNIGFSQTIINTAAISQDLDSLVSIVVDASGSFSTGNASVTRISSNSGFGFSTTENSSVWLMAGFNELKTNGDLVQQTKFAHTRFNYEPQPKLVLSLFTQIQSNFVLEMNERFLLGSNIGYKLDSSGNSMILVGAFYEHEDYFSDVEQNVFRGNLVGFTSKQFEHFQIVGFMYFQPSISNVNDYRFIGESSLRIPLGDLLKLSANFAARYDSSPHSSLSTWDTSLTLGLRFVFHKGNT